MATYLIFQPDGNTIVIKANKAMKAGQQTVFYGEDGTDIVAQIPSTWGFIKKDAN